MKAKSIGIHLDITYHDALASRLLALLELIVGWLVGKDILAICDCLTFAHAYTMPLTKPMNMAETLPKVTAASKNTRPLRAMGSLFKAPTIEYVVEEVTRMHHAEQYEMKIVPAPE